MTSSSPLRPTSHSASSAEQTPGRAQTSRTEAAQALSQLQTQHPEERTRGRYIAPSVSSTGNTPLSPVPTTPNFSLAYGSPYPSSSGTPTTSAFPTPGFHREATRPWHFTPPTEFPPAELISRTPKRPASLTELRSVENRRDSQGSHQPSEIPTSSIGAPPLPAPHIQASKRTTSRTRASASVKSKAPTRRRESPAKKRQPRRPPKNSLLPADHAASTGPSVGDDGDTQMSMRSPYSQTVAGLDTFKVPVPLEIRSAGPSSSFSGHSFPNSTALAAPSPSLWTREVRELPFFTGPRSTFPHPPLPTPQSSTAVTHWSPTRPGTSSGSSSASYLPIPPPPHQVLPLPNGNPNPSSTQQVHPSAGVDGYTIIRNAISTALIRDLVRIIDRDLPVNAVSETAQTYVTPVEAFRVRDEFVSKWLHALRPFYDPMDKSIPQMPTANLIGSFKESDPAHLRQSLLHTGYSHHIYVHIALTRLSPQTGFYEILKGSHEAKHPSRTPVNNWRRIPISLHPGDVFIWRGDLSYFMSPNGGGYWQCLTFDWGPGVVDLTG